MEKRQIETTVGIFVLIGLVIIAALVIQFGKVGQTFRGSYSLVVTFADGSGLLKGAQVRYAGTMVGRVADTPVLTTDNDGNQVVRVELRIYKEVQIREGSRISIGQSGFLGDNYIDIVPPRVPKDTPVTFIPAGKELEGTRPSDLTSLASEGTDLVERLKKVASQLEVTTGKVNETLTPETMADIQLTVKNLKGVSGQAEVLLKDINSGKGAMGKALKDPETARNFEAFVYNLRKNGILFYSDSFAEETKSKKDQRKDSKKK